MVDVDDVQGYATKFENQLEKLDAADIDERDRKAIHKFVRSVDARGQVNRGTMVSNLNRLRLSAERGPMPLVEMEKAAVDELLFSLKHEHDLSDGTVRNYRKSLRKFFKERGEPWAEDIVIGAAPSQEVDPNELLTSDELDALLEAAGNPRDKALIALLADTGLRISAIASLRLRDLDHSGQTTLVTINDDAHVKGASGTVPLTWSDGYLSSWLQVHPRRDQPDAAVIHKHGGYIDDNDDGAMTYQYLSRRIKDVADDAGVDRDRVNTHNFRKTAISNWIREGLSEQAIKHRATWDVDTDMIRTYSGVRDEELNDQILDHYDIEPSETATPTIETCPRCGTAIRDTDRFCGGCSAPLSAVAAEVLDDAEADTVRSLPDVDDERLETVLGDLFDLLKHNDEARALVAEQARDLR